MKSLFDSDSRFIRDSITIGEFAYRVDHDRSHVVAQIVGDYRWWTLVVHTINTEYPDEDDDRIPPQSSPHLSVTLPRLKKKDGNLPAFEHRSFKLEFKKNADFVGMPGEGSGAYAWDEHRHCAEATVSFDWASDSTASIRIMMLAKADEHDPGRHLYADTELRFAGVKIPSHVLDPSPQADDLFAKWFVHDDFGVPIRDFDHILYPLQS